MTCMWSNPWKIYSKNKPQTNNLIALSHSLPVKHQEICHLCHLHHQNQGQEKVHETYPRGKSSQVNLFPTFDSDKTIPREATMNETTVLQLSAVFLIDIYSMKGWIAAKRHRVTTKRSTKKLRKYRKSV